MDNGSVLITNWLARHARLFGAELVKLNHRLLETELFTREAVGRLIERCPPQHLGLRATAAEVDDPRRLEGEVGGASGLEAIAAIEKGRMWMNIRRVMDWAPEYRVLLDRVFEELEERIAGLKTFKRNIGVLVSSPLTKVFYHADIQGQSLWQIAGVKSVYIYPRSEAFISPKNVEKILLRETEEDIVYEGWFDEYATKVELHPGEMITWPLYAPHRVENHGNLNISVTMEHWTREIWKSYAVHYGNGVLRRTLGLQRPSTESRGLHVYSKAGAAFLWKRFGRQVPGELVKQRQFRIDISSADGRRLIG
jgi:hypothetical protein